ncbi:FAD linked oxidase [Macrophomina phaseolina MS6]|uniref:FAD linked oxidase n=1 Tax=Macrophomina phaseolina (strain MS6) TaxID=1126212 RepID=K2QMY5_MACPH|nr:FAD linked oxidase [Macrophomina phaseolina MS6]
MGFSALFGRLLLGLLPAANSAAVWQQRTYTHSVPQTPITTFASNDFIDKHEALSALMAALGNATVAYPGDIRYGLAVARVWTEQRKTYPDAFVFPETSEQVSIILQFYSKAHALWADGFAIMGGGHADAGGAQSPSVIIDLQKIGSTEVVSDPPKESTECAILKIGGGAEAGDVYDALDGTGWAFLGPRAASIGVGGFILGGGIAFQTGRYGVAIDSLVGIEVVLINGTITYANPYNQHSDLFWAVTGGGWLGFGVVTNFYIQAYPDPGSVYVGTIAYGEDKADMVFSNTVTWWESNTDPDAFPALLYYLKDPTQINSLVPIRDRQFTLQLDAFYFGGNEAKFNESFGQFFEGADSIIIERYTLKTLQQYLLTNYPYGYKRLFYGKSHTRSTVEFYQKTFDIYKETINGMLERGEDPGHTLWVDECKARQEFIACCLSYYRYISRMERSWPQIRR